jgi:hypothetical protein
MADSNMTIGAETTETISGKKSRLRRVTFTQTAAAAAGNATTTFTITGKLLRVYTTGGDGAWDFTLNDGTTNVFAITGINVAGTANTWPLYQTAGGGVITDDETDFAYGIPLVDQTLLCTIANGGTTAATITVIWEESDVSR